MFGGFKKRAREGKLTLKYLDETGLGLMLSVVNSWFAKGRGKQFKVPTRWGSSGRINVLGTLSLFGDNEELEYRILRENCTRKEVVDYLETLSERCKGKRTVVVLDNATFHRGGELEKRREDWEKKGMTLQYLPGYCPFLNLIETTSWSEQHVLVRTAPRGA